MLTTTGRGLAPVPATLVTPAPSALFFLTAALPAGFTYSRADTAATYRDANGRLQLAGANSPRFDHDSAGTPRGMLFEGARTNKFTGYSANPADLTGWNTGGNASAVVSVVTDTAELAKIGFQDIVGTVIKIDNTQGGSGSAYIEIAATFGNTNMHIASAWMRCTGPAGNGAQIFRSGSGSATVSIPVNKDYARYSVALIPDAASRNVRFSAFTGCITYLCLPQLEEAAFISSPIVTAGAAATRAQDSLTYTGVDSAPWFDPAAGYVTARYRPTVVATGADQFVMALHNGGSSNAIGLRLNGTDSDAQTFYRVEGASLNSGTNDVPHRPGAVQCMGFSWDSDSALLLHSGNTSTVDFAPPEATPTGINELAVGHRNGLADPFWGHIETIRIGTEKRSASALAARLYETGGLPFAGAGQSLMKGHFASQASGSFGGLNGFLEAYSPYETVEPVIVINAAATGSAAARTSDGSDTNWWWDVDLGLRGPALEAFYTAIETAGITPRAILWAQGEADSHQIPAFTPKSAYKSALNSIFTDMRAVLGDIPVLIQRIGRRTAGTYTNIGGIQAVREAQQALIDENEWCHQASETYDSGLFDEVHLDDAGYVSVSKRNARALAALRGHPVTGALGPSVTGAVRSGQTVTVTLAHDGGTDFSPASGIQGFHFFDGATEIAITAAVRAGPATITLSLATLPSGTESLYYIYDAESALVPANSVKDNATPAMPLQSIKIIL